MFSKASCRAALAVDLGRRILRPKALYKLTARAFFYPVRVGWQGHLVREDLVPQLEEEGAIVIYVDLCIDRNPDRTHFTVDALRSKAGRVGQILLSKRGANAGKESEGAEPQGHEDCLQRAKDALNYAGERPLQVFCSDFRCAGLAAKSG